MKETIAMLLAGGQGSRLYALTQDIAKPAVPFGGKYKIIDFPLSNCVNSGIDTVGVLTQYQPLELNEYIGNGRAWDLDRNYGGVHVLPPYQKATGSNWYLGTANAIYQNINFVDKYTPKYVVVLSGDHIYKMDYSLMIEQHKQTEAACTISVIEVSNEEASRFGILNANPDGTVYEFEEKPKVPKSNLASMGIYVFSWDKLKKYLEDDNAKSDTKHDFGGDIIPDMLNSGEKICTYKFSGYWKDVGTVESLWEANMDLLNPNEPFDLWFTSQKVYSKNDVLTPHYVCKDAIIENSIISEGCRVCGEIDFSVLFTNVVVKNGAKIDYSIIMPGAVIEEGATVEYSIIAENTIVKKGAKIGGKPEDAKDLESWGITVVGSNIVIQEKEVIAPNSMIYANSRNQGGAL